MTRPLSHISHWIFDLDNTLYPAENNLFELIDIRMGKYIVELLGCDPVEAHRIQKAYFHDHGTTLAGLMAHKGINPKDFLDYVHDIDLSRLSPAPRLGEMIGTLPGKKYVFTNGDREYAVRVLDKLGFAGVFSGIHDIHACNYIPKPQMAAYQTMLEAFGCDPAHSVFIEDMARNLAPAKKLGIGTIWLNNGSELGDAGAHPDFIDYEITNLDDWLGQIDTLV